MDEFRKPFEYFEEKGVGGILLLLFFMLITIEPLMGIAAIFFGYHYINNNVIGTVFIYLAVFYVLFSIVSGILIKKKSRFAVKFVKIFLIFRMVFMTPYLYVNTRMQINEIEYEKTFHLYETAYRSIVTSFIICLAYVVVFSAAWYAYLCKSKRVAELFINKDAGVKPGA